MNAMIIAQRNDRLGARLKTMVNALRIPDKSGLSFRFHWGVIKDRNYEINNYEELFEKEFLEKNIGEEEFSSIKDKIIGIPRNPSFELNELSDLLGENCAYLINGTHMYVFGNESEIKVKKELKDCFFKIGFHRSIKRVMYKMDEIINGDKSIAVHIRRGDILWPQFRWVDHGKYIPTFIYEEFIKKANYENCDDQIILFTDDFATKTHIKNTFPFVKTIEDFIDTSRFTEVQIALLDMILMSKCKRIVGPGVSAFSNFAEMIGGSVLLPVTKLFSNSEIVDLLKTNLSHSHNNNLRNSDESKIDFTMTVVFSYKFLIESDEIELLYSFVKLAREYDPDNSALENILGHIENKKGDVGAALFHLRKSSSALEIMNANIKYRQRFAFDVAATAIRVFFSDTHLTFPLPLGRGRLLEIALASLRAVESSSNQPIGRIEAALIEVLALLGRLQEAAEFLSAEGSRSSSESRSVFFRHFGRMLLTTEDARRAARGSLVKLARDDDLATALLWRLHRQDRDEAAARAALRRRPSAAQIYPWIINDTKSTADNNADFAPEERAQVEISQQMEKTWISSDFH